MKITIQTKDVEETLRMLKARDMALVLWNFTEKLRRITREKEPSLGGEKGVLDYLFSEMDSRGINLEELIS